MDVVCYRSPESLEFRQAANFHPKYGLENKDNSLETLKFPVSFAERPADAHGCSFAESVGLGSYQG